MPTGSCAFAVLAALASVAGELDGKIDSFGVFVFPVQRKLRQSGKPALCKGLPVETLEVPFKMCVWPVEIEGFSWDWSVKDWQFCQSHPHLPIWSCLRCHFGDILKTHRFVRTLQLDGQGNVQNSEYLKSFSMSWQNDQSRNIVVLVEHLFLSQVLACIEHSCQCLPEHVLQCYVSQQTEKRRFFPPGRRTVSRPVSQYLDSKLTSCENKLCWSQELSGQRLLCQFSSGSNRWWFAGSSVSYLKIGCSADDFHDQFFASCSLVLPR